MTKADDNVEVMTTTDRWILKIVGSLLVTGIAGGVAVLMMLRTDIAVMQAQMSGLANAVAAATANRYDSDMAAKDQMLINQMIKMVDNMARENKDEISNNREHIRKIEQAVGSK